MSNLSNNAFPGINRAESQARAFNIDAITKDTPVDESKLYEAMEAELLAIVNELEKKNLGIERSLDIYSYALRLQEAMKRKLDRIEQEVMAVQKSGSGEPTLVPKS